MDVSGWREQPDATAGEGGAAPEPISSGNAELEAFRRRLEGLL